MCASTVESAVREPSARGRGQPSASCVVEWARRQAAGQDELTLAAARPDGHLVPRPEQLGLDDRPVDLLLKDVEEARLAHLLRRLGPLEDGARGVAQLAEPGRHGRRSELGRERPRPGWNGWGSRRRRRRRARGGSNGEEAALGGGEGVGGARSVSGAAVDVGRRAEVLHRPPRTRPLRPTGPLALTRSRHKATRGHGRRIEVQGDRLQPARGRGEAGARGACALRAWGRRGPP